jgi:hypothetical protein
MAKGLSVKDAIKMLEEKKGVVATEVEKASTQWLSPCSTAWDVFWLD